MSAAAMFAYLVARKRNKRIRDAKAVDAVIEALKDEDDIAEDARIAADTKQRMIDHVSRQMASRKEQQRSEGCCRRWWRRLVTVLNHTLFQTVQYVAMLCLFQSLTTTIRIESEFHMDRLLGSMLLTKDYRGGSRGAAAPHSHDHRRFAETRTIADVWEWMAYSLTPALFHNADAGEVCASVYCATASLSSPWRMSDCLAFACTVSHCDSCLPLFAQAWPDGSGVASAVNATPLSVHDSVEQATHLRIDAVVFKQVRMRRDSRKPCYAQHACTTVLGGPNDAGDTEGYAHGNMSQTASKRFPWWSSSALGADPAGVISASHLTAGLSSVRSYSSSGFVAVWKPFFSSEWSASTPD